MNKILVIGNCGAGKSTLAAFLSKELKLPLICLDQHYWQPGWVKTLKPEWVKIVKELLMNDKWIMDGNYKITLNIRVPACDLVVLFDLNRFVCLWRAIKRQIFKNRIDNIKGCKDRLSFEFLLWILWGYPRKGKREIESCLRENHDKPVIRIRSNKDLESVLENIKRIEG